MKTTNGNGEAGPSAAPSGRSENGNGSANGIGNGLNHGHAQRTVKPVQLSGTLMYQDDEDWLQYQDTTEGIDETSEVEMGDKASISKRRRWGIAAAKRMPAEREEVIRLILQSLRDIGYQ